PMPESLFAALHEDSATATESPFAALHDTPPERPAQFDALFAAAADSHPYDESSGTDQLAPQLITTPEERRADVQDFLK
uniref:hypothetical protein n=1 Tax=Fusobacterium mortiferum TaxID=850 RepID=UPI00195836E7